MPNERRLPLVQCSFCKKEEREPHRLLVCKKDTTVTICVHCARNAAHQFSVALDDDE
jgi:hypothetical protein